MILVSHPDRSLFTHLYGLMEVVEKVFPEKTQHFWTEERFKEFLELLVLYHDIVKSSDYFQFKIIRITVQSDTNFSIENRTELETFLSEKKHIGVALVENSNLSRHGELGAYLLQSEFLEETLDVEQLILLMVIKKHHGNLQNFTPSNFAIAKDDIEGRRELLEKIFEVIPLDNFVKTIEPLGRLKHEQISLDTIFKRFSKKRAIQKLLSGLSKQPSVEPFLKTIFLYSLLLSADKGDVKLMTKEQAFNRTNISSDIIDQFKNSSNVSGGKKIDAIRQEAYELVLSNLKQNPFHYFYTITLPTGLGKTFSAYKAALWLKEHHFPNHRIVYCLPFTSIIDQNAGLLEAIFEFAGHSKDLITIHHYLTQPPEKDEHGNEIDTQESEYVTEGWQNEVIVSTFVQLLESIFTNSNKRLRKFHNLANSIIILDEIQGVEAKYYPVLKQVFEKMAERFNTCFFFVTATQPLIMPDKVMHLAAPAGETSAKYFFDKMNRIVLDKSMLKKTSNTVEEVVAKAVHVFNEGNTVLTIFNTIRQSQEAYELIKKALPYNNVRYLSAAMTPYCRQRVVNAVKQDLKDKTLQVLVSTQVVEAGVDIDFDRVFRDFAPMSSINQSAGRCNRNSINGIGTVYLFDCGKAKSIYDDILLSITRDIFTARDGLIKESDIFELNRTYFQNVKAFIQDDNDVANSILKHIYELQFEDLKQNFKVIKTDYPKWNVFIPLNEEAKDIWKKYRATAVIEGRWERKAAVKKLMPDVLQYVVAIPEQYYNPDDDQKEKVLIYEHNWPTMYDLEKGYFKQEASHTKSL